MNPPEGIPPTAAPPPISSPIAHLIIEGFHSSDLMELTKNLKNHELYLIKPQDPAGAGVFVPHFIPHCIPQYQRHPFVRSKGTDKK